MFSSESLILMNILLNEAFANCYNIVEKKVFLVTGNNS